MFRHMRCLNRQQWAAAVLGLCLLTLAAIAGPLFAHEGHDHGDHPSDAIAATFPRVAARSADHEIVGVLKEGGWSITLDDARTNAPVDDATLLITVGAAQPAEADRIGPGLFRMPLTSVPEGATTIGFVVSTARGEDRLTGSLVMATASPNDHSHAHVSPFVIASAVLGLMLASAAATLLVKSRGRLSATPAALALAACAIIAVSVILAKPVQHVEMARLPVRSDAPRRLADGTAFVAKTTQRLLEVRTKTAETTTTQAASHLIGRVIADPNHSGIVQSLYGGRVVAGETSLPRIGQRVARGDALVEIEPYLPVADRTTISEKTGEIEQSMAIAATRLRRLRPLAAGGAVPASQISDLETELEGLKARRETVMTLRTNREVLRAPTDGVITSANAVPGQVIQPQDVLFQIVDPQALWVEALSYGDDHKEPAQASATAAGGQSFALSFLGASRALRQHASVMHFAIPQVPSGLNIGQPVTVLMRGGAPETGYIVPRDAIVSAGSGESVVWLHVAPERFEPRPVRTKPIDAAHMLVASGIENGDRVVIRAADLISQIR